MAILTYNDIPLNLLRTMDFASEAVMSDDGVDYLYTRIRIDAMCVFNPSLSPDLTFGQGLGVDMRRKLREQLLVPRMPLLFVVGGDIVIDLLSAGEPCDANNGPRPLHCRVIRIDGDKTAIVSFSVECFVTDTDCTNVVLSNRWTTRTWTDENAHTTRYINGVATLRADYMQEGDWNADDFRRGYFCPVPDQFQRVGVGAELSSDGTELRYTLVDKELDLAIGDQLNVTKVEGVVTAGITMSSEFAARLASAAAPIVQGGLQRITNWFGGSFGGVPSAIGTLSQSAVNVPFNALSNGKAHCLVRVTGNRFAQKKDLANIAVAVAIERLNITEGFGIQSNVIMSAYCSQSISNRFVEVRIECLPGLASKNIIEQSPVGVNFEPIMNLNNDIQGFFNKIQLDYQAGDSPANEGTGPSLFQGDTRGTWLGALLAQALNGACENPDPPPENFEAVDLLPEDVSGEDEEPEEE